MTGRNQTVSRQADELSTLLALSEHGSFAAAGRMLQRHPSVLSKRLSALELRLGIRLVERTTRQLRFTDEGQRLVSQLGHAVSLISQAEQEAAQGAAQVRGRLRLALPTAMGRLWLSAVVSEFALVRPSAKYNTATTTAFKHWIEAAFARGAPWQLPRP